LEDIDAIGPPSEGLVEFEFYGVGLSVASSSPELLRSFARDFGYFARTASARTVSVEAHLAPPPWDRVPAEVASRISPNAVTFDRGSVRYNDYYGEALAIYDFSRETGEVWSENPDLLYEITYLLCLSRIGEIHDLRGIHRVHALGISLNDRGALILLPEGGGKSTLCMAMLRHREVRVLSDDTPLYSRGKLLAFPMRIGLRGADGYGIPPEFLRVMHRRNRASKTLIDVRYFRDRIAADATPNVVIVGARRNGDESWIEPIGAAGAMSSLTANLVFGLGLPQVVEFFLRGGAREALSKLSIARSRFSAAAALAWRARLYRLTLGRDVDAAARAVISVMKT
jgi:hypothetical protein